MSAILTQSEADALLALEKHYRGEAHFIFPSYGGELRIPLKSTDNREEFSLDIWRSSISLTRNKFQNRARKSIVLVRVDIGGANHRNPDGTEVPCPRIHIYRSGFADKWAEPLSSVLSNTENQQDILREFMDFCHIVSKPIIQEDLFS